MAKAKIPATPGGKAARWPKTGKFVNVYKREAEYRRREAKLKQLTGKVENE